MDKVAVLLDAGAVLTRNRDGYSPLDYARSAAEAGEQGQGQPAEAKAEAAAERELVGNLFYEKQIDGE